MELLAKIAMIAKAAEPFVEPTFQLVKLLLKAPDANYSIDDINADIRRIDEDFIARQRRAEEAAFEKKV